MWRHHAIAPLLACFPSPTLVFSLGLIPPGWRERLLFFYPGCVRERVAAATSPPPPHHTTKSDTPLRCPPRARATTILHSFFRSTAGPPLLFLFAAPFETPPQHKTPRRTTMAPPPPSFEVQQMTIHVFYKTHKKTSPHRLFSNSLTTTSATAATPARSAGCPVSSLLHSVGPPSTLTSNVAAVGTGRGWTVHVGAARATAVATSAAQGA